jgi:hypothetical protein
MCMQGARLPARRAAAVRLLAVLVVTLPSATYGNLTEKHRAALLLRLGAVFVVALPFLLLTAGSDRIRSWVWAYWFGSGPQ